MSVLIVKNISTEGPGTIGDFLAGKGMPYTTVDLTAEGFPSAALYDTLVMMGGPMSVNESDIYPHIDKEAELARDFMKQGKKVFGVCLGAQIMAKALGAKVYPGPEKEIGWYDIELTGEGLQDRRMAKLATHPHTGDFRRTFKVFHWHGETFDIPEGAVQLAKSGLYPNQAFRYGDNAYAFQFHIEVRRQMIFDWLKNEQVDMAKIEKETESCYTECEARAMSFYEAFFKDGRSVDA
jgi:GMP synthase-like glutamine amidotransferase